MPEIGKPLWCRFCRRKPRPGEMEHSLFVPVWTFETDQADGVQFACLPCLRLVIVHGKKPEQLRDA